MAVSMADITKLRKMTGAGMMDCKNALTEAEGDFDKAMEIIRKKGQAVAAKRSEREASEGCVLAKTTGDRAVIVALKCISYKILPFCERVIFRKKRRKSLIRQSL